MASSMSPFKTEYSKWHLCIFFLQCICFFLSSVDQLAVTLDNFLNTTSSIVTETISS